MMKKWGGFAKTLACVALCGLAMLPSAASAISGTWVQDRDTNPQMQYMISGTTVDVQGMHNNSWLRTTYSDQGYQVIRSDNLGNATITAKPSFINEGRFVQLKYIVEATNGDVTDGRFAVYTDVQIGTNDSAPLMCIYNRKGQVIGLKMSESASSGAAQFNLYFSQSGGVTDVSTYWFGHYSTAKDSNTVYKQITAANAGTGYRVENGKLIGITGVDTGFVVSWQNINLKKGEKKEFSILVGVGEAADPPEFDSSSPIKLNMDLNATKNNLKINVEANVKDKAGVTDTLYYEEEGGKQGTLGSVTADGSFKTIAGQLDLTGKPDGTYVYKFWLGSSQGVMSETVTCTITIKNGAVTGDVTKPAEGDHNWSDKWSYDANNHWHICTNGNCTITDVTQNKDYEKHERDDGVVTNGIIVFHCKKCGYEIERRPAIRHEIAYEPNEGTMPSDTRNFYYEGQEFPLPIPSKQCYTFEGWYENPDFSGAPVDKILYTDKGDRKFYAKWKENEKHNIKFDVDGGKNPEDTKGTFTEGEDTKLPIPKKDGFIFDGWYTDPDFKGDPVTKIDPNATGDLKYYAKWKVDPSMIANLPKTGDSANPLMWVVVLAAAGACAIGLKKKHA